MPTDLVQLENESCSHTSKEQMLGGITWPSMCAVFAKAAGPTDLLFI